MVAGTGCVDRVINDFPKADGDGDGGRVDTDTDGIGDTEQVDDSSGTTDGVPPGMECAMPEDCADTQTCFEGVCVGTGTLRISLSWTAVTDLDLHVFVPNGESINFENSLTPYGELDVDDCVGGDCVNNGGTHVENVFLEASAPRGNYGIQVINYDGRRAADFSIEVAGAVDAGFSGSLPANSFAESQVYNITW